MNARFLILEMLAVKQSLPAEDAFPGIEPEEREDFALQESLSIFAAKAAGTAFATNHDSTLLQ
jgi:hypothetical protein